jgi:hypothetical protein
VILFVNNVLRTLFAEVANQDISLIVKMFALPALLIVVAAIQQQVVLTAIQDFFMQILYVMPVHKIATVATQRRAFNAWPIFIFPALIVLLALL